MWLCVLVEASLSGKGFPIHTLGKTLPETPCGPCTAVSWACWCMQYRDCAEYIYFLPEDTRVLITQVYLRASLLHPELCILIRKAVV